MVIEYLPWFALMVASSTASTALFYQCLVVIERWMKRRRAERAATKQERRDEYFRRGLLRNGPKVRAVMRANPAGRSRPRLLW